MQKEKNRTKNGRGSRYVGHRARSFIGADLYLLRSRTTILGVKVSILYLFVFASEKPCNQRLFSPLLRNKSASFPHTFRCLSAGNFLSAVRAVFDIIRLRRKGRSAHGTLPHIVGMIKLRIEQLIKRKYGNPKPLAEQRIRNKLRADTFLPVVQ